MTSTRLIASVLCLTSLLLACEDPVAPPVSGLDDVAVDALYRALRDGAGGAPLDRYDGATRSVAAVCDGAAAGVAAEAIAIANVSPEPTLRVACGDADWLTQVTDAVDAHDGTSWLIVELGGGTCTVPTDHVDDTVIRIDTAQRVELRGDGATVDAAAWSSARAGEAVIVTIENSQDVVVRGLTLTGVSTANAGSDAGGILIGGSTRVAVLDNRLRDLGVDYDSVDDAANANAFAIKVTGLPSGPTSQVLVRGNRVTGLRTGQSENITLAGDVSGFAVVGNVLHDVDNIGIDLIGGEDYEGAQARGGVLCGNAMGGERELNPAYDMGDAAAAGVYLDGGGNDCLIALNVVEGFSRGFEIGAEQANPTVRNTHLFGNVSDAARGAGLLMGSLAERVDPSQPTDEGTLVERHLIVRNPSADILSCTEGASSSDEGAAQCEAGSVSRRGIEVCLSGVVPDGVAACGWVQSE